MVGIVTDQRYSFHLTRTGDLEQPERNEVVIRELVEKKLLTPEYTIAPRMATDSEIELCHTRRYHRLVKDECKGHGEKPGLLSTSEDTSVMNRSEEIARLAVGGVLAGVDYVMNDNSPSKSVFCVVRPPGHHACEKKGHGFCIYNNIAIGAKYAQKKYGLKRIFIVDWDAHHGDGTQNMFYKDGSVFYFSTHQADLYPHTGRKSEIGEGEGKGTTLNIPIESWDSKETVINIYQTVLPKLMGEFKPDLVMISAGFDGHIVDPLGAFNFNEYTYSVMTRIVKDLAEVYAGGRVVSVLEGGYNVLALKECCVWHVKALESTKTTKRKEASVEFQNEPQKKDLASIEVSESSKASDEETITYMPISESKRPRKQPDPKKQA